jgi:hypothetical protein
MNDTVDRPAAPDGGPEALAFARHYLQGRLEDEEDASRRFWGEPPAIQKVKLAGYRRALIDLEDHERELVGTRSEGSKSDEP